MTKLISCLCLGLLIALPSYADTVMRGHNSYWLCKAYDESNKQFMAQNSYQKVALNKAYDKCKSASKSPGTCRTATEYCESYVKGRAQQAFWQCTALDFLAQAWVSDGYNTLDEAAIGARKFCEQQSGLPDACYVNLLTCENKNNSFW